MKFLDDIKGVDIYLLDQLMKKNINSTHRVLDAGCGKGRNLRLFFDNDLNAVGFDSNETFIKQLRNDYPSKANQIHLSSIEIFTDKSGFDVIICNAVLHFALSHDHFDEMFCQLDRNLRTNGLLFIRMTSHIGLNSNVKSNSGVHLLPDGTNRYLITQDKIEKLLEDYSYQLVEPIKTVNVSDQRCMTTLVFRK